MRGPLLPPPGPAWPRAARAWPPLLLSLLLPCGQFCGLGAWLHLPPGGGLPWPEAERPGSCLVPWVSSWQSSGPAHRGPGWSPGSPRGLKGWYVQIPPPKPTLRKQWDPPASWSPAAGTSGCLSRKDRAASWVGRWKPVCGPPGTGRAQERTGWRWTRGRRGWGCSGQPAGGDAPCLLKPYTPLALRGSQAGGGHRKQILDGVPLSSLGSQGLVPQPSCPAFLALAGSPVLALQATWSQTGWGRGGSDQTHAWFLPASQAGRVSGGCVRSTGGCVGGALPPRPHVFLPP